MECTCCSIQIANNQKLFAYDNASLMLMSAACRAIAHTDLWRTYFFSLSLRPANQCAVRAAHLHQCRLASIEMRSVGTWWARWRMPDRLMPITTIWERERIVLPNNVHVECVANRRTPTFTHISHVGDTHWSKATLRIVIKICSWHGDTQFRACQANVIIHSMLLSHRF